MEFAKSQINMGMRKKVTSNGLAKLSWQNPKCGSSDYFVRQKFSSRHRLQGPSNSWHQHTNPRHHGNPMHWKDESMAMAYVPPPQPA